MGGGRDAGPPICELRGRVCTIGSAVGRRAAEKVGRELGPRPARVGVAPQLWVDLERIAAGWPAAAGSRQTCAASRPSLRAGPAAASVTAPGDRQTDSQSENSHSGDTTRGSASLSDSAGQLDRFSGDGGEGISHQSILISH